MVDRHTLLTALIGLWTPLSVGCPIDTTRFLDDRFASELSALHRVAAEVGPDSVQNDVEYAGALYRVDDAYRINLGRGCPGEDTFTIRLPVPRGHSLIAFWHTHGTDGAMRSWFSPEDFELVAAHRRPFYLITPDGELRVLRPGMRNRQGATLGQVSGARPGSTQLAFDSQSSIAPRNR
ncbi:MAG: DUF4329 domain-containing protein [Pseudomonadales bacterium]